MTKAITDQVVVAYSQCPLKAHLLMYSDERDQLHEYQQILERNRLANQAGHVASLKPNAYPYNLENLKKGRDLLISARLTADGLQADCDVLTRVDKHTYEPTILIGTHIINDTDKLHLMFIGHVLAKVQGNPPATGHIITVDGKSSKVRLQQSRKTLIALLEPLQKWSAADSPPAEPPIILNKHCPLCQFRDQCEAKAIQEDNLSRLAGVTPRVIRRYERKGIFTVKQLSYLFKPHKRKKRSKNPPPTSHNIELQALAIRTGRIYLQELPTLTRQETELFLDIESVPDQGLHYLLSLLICQGETATYHPFWANQADEEETVWQAFLALVNQYPAAPIYHYGSYEPRTIARLARQYATDSENLTKRLINRRFPK